MVRFTNWRYSWFLSTGATLAVGAFLGVWFLLHCGPDNRILALAPAPPMDLEQSLKKASMDGKYAMLLHQFKDDKDGEEYGECHEYGYQNVTEQHEQKELSKGCWVYGQPYWYVWEKRNDSKRQAR